MNNKFIYFHVPKSAGSSLNNFLASNIDAYLKHIENEKIDRDSLKKYNALSGHVPFSRIEKLFDLNCVTTLITFREPYSYVASHLAWIRKLADEGEEERFHKHPKIFQKIALKMKEFDFSQSSDIEKFIIWLEDIKFFYLHNTQTLYLDLNKNIDQAIKNLNKIDFVGITDKLDEFIDILAYEFDFVKPEESKINANKNSNKYGLDITDEKTKKALFPLIDKDIVVYDEATKAFNRLKKTYYDEVDLILVGFIEETEKMCKGWAKYKNSHKHVELGLYIKNELVETTKATIYRKNLKCKGIDNTGNCEFKFNFSIENGSDVVVKDLVTGQELPKIKRVL